MSGKKKPNKKKPIKRPGYPPKPVGSTTLKTAAKVGDTRLDVVDQAGFQVGQQIVIDAGTAVEEFNVISGFGSILVESPLKFAHAAGAPVAKSDGPPPANGGTEKEPLLPAAAGAYAAPISTVAMPVATVAMPMTTVATTARAMPAATVAMPTTSYAMPSYSMAAATTAMPAATYAMPATSSFTASPTYAMPAATVAMPSATYATPTAYMAQPQYGV